MGVSRMGSAGASVEMGKAPRIDKRPGDSIALIEDDDDVRDALEDLLVRSGYQVDAYDRSRSALTAMDAGAVPDAILLDLMMPGMNGWEFRVQQRARPTLAQIPVIVLSADTSPYAAAIDAAAYVQKPVDFSRLYAVLSNVLIASKREQLAQKTIELERLRTLGLLVASVAHEINNPLTYVMGNLDLADTTIEALRPARADRPGALDSLAQNIAAVRDGAERVAFIVQLLSTFVRTDKDDVQVVDPLRAVDAAVRLSSLHIRDRARLVCTLNAVPKVRTNEARLAQALLNLLLNAAQAIPPGAPHANEVRVRSSCTGPMVTIEIEDTGRGIPAELQARIFEPFFSTKALDGSPGVGLSIAHDIITALGGTLSVHSSPGRGAMFRVELPAVVDSPEPDKNAQTQQRPGEAPPQRILVVDDEPMVGKIVQTALEGQVVETSVDPAQALEGVADRSYDLILCDLKMPVMSGIEFYTELIKRRPDLKRSFVLMTGAALDQELDFFISSNSITVLRKPFTIAELRKHVARRAREPRAMSMQTSA